MLPNAETGSEEAVTTETVAASSTALQHCKQGQQLQPHKRQATQMTEPPLESEETRTGGGETETRIESQDHRQGEFKTQWIRRRKPQILGLKQDPHQSRIMNPS